ncbi:MAG TPA: recombinase family protein [Symbiobacteriaceae bacterium]|nr:recombinase family protein [Symbiobacteriaceae bacterium]
MFGNSRKIDPNKVAIYIRWSTEEQGQGTTLEVQRDACVYYCKSQGWNSREDLVFIDEGFSGATLDRPGLAQLRKAVKEHQVECVVVYKLDRLSRNLLDCVSLVRKEWGEACALYSTKENFDTQSPVGQMVFNILVSFAEFERNVIRDRTQSGKTKRAQQGRNAGQWYPYGYKKGDDGNWALDGWDAERQCFTGRAAIARRIFDEYLAGVSAREIADRLRNEGVPSSRGGAWRYNTISALLGNEAYSGIYTYGKARGGKRGQEPLYAVEGALPPIVTQKEWDSVQRMRKEKLKISPRALGSKYLISGLARCGKCGGSITGAGNEDRGGSKGRLYYRYYTCTNRIFLKNCDCAYINADKLEQAVVEEVKAAVSLENIRHHVQVMEDQLQQRIEQCSHVAAEARDTLAGIDRKRKRLDQEFFAGNLDGKSLARLTDALEGETREAERRLKQAEADLREARATTVDVEQMVALARRVDAWAELSTDEVKQILRDVVGSMTVYQQKVPTRQKKGNQNPIDIVWQPRLNLLYTVGPKATLGIGDSAD